MSLLAQLTALDVSSNSISGSIPVEALSHVPLQFMNLSRNQLTGDVAPLMSLLVSAVTLDLSSNRLTGTTVQDWDCIETATRVFVYASMCACSVCLCLVCMGVLVVACVWHVGHR